MKKNNPDKDHIVQRSGDAQSQRVKQKRLVIFDENPADGQVSASSPKIPVIQKVWRFFPPGQWLILIIALALALVLVVSCKLLPADGTQGTTDHSTSDTAPDNSSLTSQTSQPSISSEPGSQSSDNTTTETSTDITETETTTAPSATSDQPGLSDPSGSWTSEQIDGLSQEPTAWYFVRPSQKYEDQPATLSAQLSDLIEPFDVIWQMPSTGTKTVYLTMDEGYEYEDNSTRILDTAREKNVSITFFITGDFIDKNPDLVERMVNEGHQVANHTVNHPDLAKLQAETGADSVLRELTDLEKKFNSLTGQNLARLVRPPMGSFSPQLLAVLNNSGYYPVFWSFAYTDWYTDNQPDPAAALDQIIGELHDGSVILIHAVSKTNVEILPDLIDAIRDSGYQIELLPEP